MENQKLELASRLLKENKITVDEFLVLVKQEPTTNVYPVYPFYNQPYWGGLFQTYCGTQTKSTTNSNTHGTRN